MAGITLYDYQKDALERMKIGCILCGGVGSGKSRTSLAFYYTLCGGAVNTQNYVNLTRTDMDILGDIAEALAECGCLGMCDFLRRVQSEVTKIVEYQEER